MGYFLENGFHIHFHISQISDDFVQNASYVWLGSINTRGPVYVLGWHSTMSFIKSNTFLWEVISCEGVSRSARKEISRHLVNIAFTELHHRTKLRETLDDSTSSDCNSLGYILIWSSLFYTNNAWLNLSSVNYDIVSSSHSSVSAACPNNRNVLYLKTLVIF